MLNFSSILKLSFEFFNVLTALEGGTNLADEYFYKNES